MFTTLVNSRPIRRLGTPNRRRILSLLSVVVASTIGLTLISSTAVQATFQSAKSTDLPSFGDNGASVVRLQQALVARGFTLRGGITGNFDAATRTTLKALQKVAGFKATGALDSKTAKFLGLADTTPLTSSNFPKVGMSGDEVWSLQQALINNGAILKGGADGKFGLATTIAIGKFQATKGLSVTKVLDKSTAIALGLVAAPTPVVTAVAKPAVTAGASKFPIQWEHSDAVRNLQTSLLRNGITVNGGVDGIYGTATIAALAAFQGRHGLPANGILDEPTSVALGVINQPVPTVTVSITPVSVQLNIDSLPTLGQRSDAVRTVQNALVAAGIEVKGGADGIFGIATAISIGKFQESQNIPVTKTLDVRTAIALGVLPSVENMGLTAINVFPVQGSCSFTDSWHDLRSGGRLHIGVDITATTGKALYAVVDGTISQVTVGGSLSGNALRLSQSDGTYFFYAHMDSFAVGIGVGTPVRAGQIIGYVGATGNAGGPHLHFEVHPFGGDAVNPYQVVKVVDACNVTEVLPQS
jgi:peptidoglycan hydrolase-like protein with peptidoglycan-binding domain